MTNQSQGGTTTTNTRTSSSSSGRSNFAEFFGTIQARVFLILSKLKQRLFFDQTFKKPKNQDINSRERKRKRGKVSETPNTSQDSNTNASKVSARIFSIFLLHPAHIILLLFSIQSNFKRKKLSRNQALNFSTLGTK